MGNASGAGTPAVASTPRGVTPRLASALAATPRNGAATSAGSDGQPRAPPTPRTLEEKASEEESTQRVLKKLAELGIDPVGMTSNDILRVFYARGSGSAYFFQNREAESRVTMRASTPRSFAGVLKKQAHDQVRAARDKPATEVHDCLDKWEVETLAAVCRSIKHFDDQAKGYTSEYSRQYDARAFGDEPNRKKFVRPPT